MNHETATHMPTLPNIVLASISLAFGQAVAWVSSFFTQENAWAISIGVTVCLFFVGKFMDYAFQMYKERHK